MKSSRKRKIHPVPEKPNRAAQRARETMEQAHPGSTSSAAAISPDAASAATQDLSFIEPAFAALQRELGAFRDAFVSRDRFQFICAAFDDLELAQRHLRFKLGELVLVSAFLARHGVHSAPCGVFSALPLELVVHIFSFLSSRDLLTLALVSHRFSRLARDDALWRRHVAAQRFTLPLPPLPSPLPPLISQFAQQSRVCHRWRHAPRTQRTLVKHASQVSCAQFLGDLIVSGGFDRRVVLWRNLGEEGSDPVSFDRSTAGEVHEDRVLCLHLSAPGTLATGGRDESVRVWDLQAMRCVRVLRGHTDNVWWLRRHADVIVSASADKSVRVWDVRSGECVHRHEAHTRGLSCLHYDGGSVMVTGSADKTVKVWDVRMLGEMREMRVLAGHDDAVYCLYVHGNRMVSGGEDQKICMWDLGSGQLKYRIQDQGTRAGGGVYCVQFDDRKLVRGAYNSSVKIWDIEGDLPKEVVDFSGSGSQPPPTQPSRSTTSPGFLNHSDTVRAVQFDDFKMISASADKTVKVWNFL